MIELHDGNYQEFVETIQSESPHLLGALPRRGGLGQIMNATPYADTIELIPKSQWQSRIEGMQGRFIRQKYDSYKPVHQNQGQHPLCWDYAATQHVECKRAGEGLPYVQLAPESILGCNGYRDSGGELSVAVKWLAEHGIAPRVYWPQYCFDPRQAKAGWQDVALGCVVLKWLELGTEDMAAEVITAICDGKAVYTAYNRLRHAMNAEEFQWKNGGPSLWLRNTWQVTDSMLMSGNLWVPDEAYVMEQVTYSTSL